MQLHQKHGNIGSLGLAIPGRKESSNTAAPENKKRKFSRILASKHKKNSGNRSEMSKIFKEMK
jgi:hypothetical protein